eukprot:1431342-Rhodomonas_salina.1
MAPSVVLLPLGVKGCVFERFLLCDDTVRAVCKRAYVDVEGLGDGREVTVYCVWQAGARRTARASKGGGGSGVYGVSLRAERARKGQRGGESKERAPRVVRSNCYYAIFHADLKSKTKTHLVDVESVKEWLWDDEAHGHPDEEEGWRELSVLRERTEQR